MEKDREENNQDVEWGVPSGPPPKINLPFGRKRKRDIGEWIYDNRETICITVIVYLVLGISIIVGKLIISPEEDVNSLNIEIVDQDELSRLQEELERAQELNRLLNQSPDNGPVKNAVSNENSTESRVREGSVSKETNEIMERSRQVMRDMERNSDEYEQSLSQIKSSRTDKASSQKRQDARVEGNVTVSFSLTNPLRNSARLDVPAYKCYGGGKVVVNIVVDRNGDVATASIDKTRSTADNCMAETALEAALNSRFNVEPSAPARHSGFIVYTFVPQ